MLAAAAPDLRACSEDIVPAQAQCRGNTAQHQQGDGGGCIWSASQYLSNDGWHAVDLWENSSVYDMVSAVWDVNAADPLPGGTGIQRQCSASWEAR
jgi:hypothetical protein